MDLIVGTQQLADVIGKTPKWVNTLTREGVLEQISRGKYDLADSIQRYIKHAQHSSDNTDVTQMSNTTMKKRYMNEPSGKLPRWSWLKKNCRSFRWMK